MGKVWKVEGNEVTLDTMLDHFLTINDGYPETRDLWLKAQFMRDTRDVDRAMGRVPRAPMVWLDDLEAIEKETR